MEGHLLLTDLLEEFGGAYLVDILRIIVLLVMEHFQRKYGKHEELFLWIPLILRVHTWSHWHIRLAHQLLLEQIRLILIMKKVGVVDLLSHLRDLT